MKNQYENTYASINYKLNYLVAMKKYETEIEILSL